jgi:hypothetical protein
VLNAAAGDPILDGLVAWYAMEADHLSAGHAARPDLGQLVAALTGAARDTHLHAGHSAGAVAAAGVLRAASPGCPV